MHPHGTLSLDARFGEMPNGRHARELARWDADMGRWLCFDGELEPEFVTERTPMKLPLARTSLAIALGFFVSFLFVDAATFRAYTHPWLWAIAFGPCAGSVLLALLLSYTPAGQRHFPLLAGLVLVFNAAGLVAMVGHGTRVGVNVPYETLIIHMLFDFFLLGVRYRFAFPLSVLTGLAYVLLNQALGMAPQPLMESSFFLLGTVLLGSMACRRLEMAERRSWLQGHALAEASRLDPLTGVLNHAAFYARCEQVLAQAQRARCPVALAVVDLDKFKAFNDTRGHLAGDECLCAITEVLRASARRPLDLVARLGGDEFALLWFGTDAESACGYAEALRARVEALGDASDDGRAAAVTLSIGLSVMHDRQCSAEQLVHEADTAMYRAKQAGGNRVCLDPEELAVLD